MWIDNKGLTIYQQINDEQLIILLIEKPLLILIVFKLSDFL